jgi:integrase
MTYMLRTRNGLPKHCTYQADRYGNRRVRFRRRGVSVYLTGIPWSEDFMREYAATLEREGAARTQIGAIKRTLPGSFSALCVSYYGSPEFRGLAAITQRVRRNMLERFRAEHGHRPLKDLQNAHIRSIIGAKVDTPEAANNLLKTLRVLLNYAVEIGMIASNPAVRVKTYRNHNSEGYHTWSEDEIAAFEAAHPIGSKARLALALALYTGQRRGDIVRMGWQNVRADRISVRQQKTGAKLTIPIHPELARALTAASKNNLTFLMTEHGASFTAAGLGNWFRDRCNEAGLRQCSIHGLRKSACRRLAEAGCSANEIAAISGHTSLREVARYTAAASQVHLADQALDRQLRAEREQNLPNNKTQVYPTAKKQ